MFAAIETGTIELIGQKVEAAWKGLTQLADVIGKVDCLLINVKFLECKRHQTGESRKETGEGDSIVESP